MAAFSKKKTSWVILFLLFLALVAGAYDVAEISPWNYPLRDFFRARPFRLGLDLVGGTHLVYEADTSNIPGSDRGDALEGVRDVIERRVNSLGVSEPVIQTARVGETWRVLVELAGVQEVKEAIALIGETPLLEFKEVNDAPPPELSAEQKKTIDERNGEAKKKAGETLALLQKGQTDFLELAKERSDDSATKDKGGEIGFVKATSPGREAVFTAAEKAGVGKLVPEVVETDDGFHVVRVEEKGEEEEIRARHILVCYDGASLCENDTTKSDARKKIEELKIKATKDNFADLARENSTEPGAKESGGDLGWFSRGRMVAPFEEAVFALKKETISDLIETEFGFHLILKTDERRVPTYRVRHILFKKLQEQDLRPMADPWKNTALSGKQLERAQLQFDPNTNEALVGIEFSNEGANLFEEITGRNVGKPIAIFLDGSLISAPTVNEKITGGSAVITGRFSVEEARLLSRRLNAGALPVPITLVSQTTVGPTLGHASLTKSLFAGLIGFFLVAVFMILYYRLSGVIAVLVLLMYTAFLLTLFRLIPVTLTLSGIAGFILSLGMAVDANVLVFERMKEELRAGKPLFSSCEEGFRRAWPSIRDGNVTTLLSAAILFSFSSSLVRGFALILGLGVLLSMFSALIITRYLLRWVTFRAVSPWWFGVEKRELGIRN